MMSKLGIYKLVKIVVVAEILGGVACFLGGIRLQQTTDKLIKDGILTVSNINKLTIYIWLSCLISFLLAYGLYNLRHWARKLLLIFAAFGVLNVLIQVTPNISSFIVPYLPNPSGRQVESLKTLIFIAMDCLLVIFFINPKVKKEFR